MLKDYVLFDLDGTLLNSLPLIEATFYHIFEQMNLPWAGGVVMKTVGLPLGDACRQFGGDRWPEMLESYVNYQRLIHDDYMKLYPGVAESLAELKPLLKGMGVVTSKRRLMARRGMSFTGIDVYFSDHLVAIDDVQKAKPHGEPVIKGAAYFGVHPEETVFIGDSYYDIASGKNAGAVTIGVTWGIASFAELKQSKPDYIVDTWPQLVALLKRDRHAL